MIMMIIIIIIQPALRHEAERVPVGAGRGAAGAGEPVQGQAREAAGPHVRGEAAAVKSILVKWSIVLVK